MGGYEADSGSLGELEERGSWKPAERVSGHEGKGEPMKDGQAVCERHWKEEGL